MRNPNLATRQKAPLSEAETDGTRAQGRVARAFAEREA